jgi:hypothetical protein
MPRRIQAAVARDPLPSQTRSTPDSGAYEEHAGKSERSYTAVGVSRKVGLRVFLSHDVDASRNHSSHLDIHSIGLRERRAERTLHIACQSVHGPVAGSDIAGLDLNRTWLAPVVNTEATIRAPE